MKDISTLIPDVYELVGRKDGWFNTETAGLVSSEATSRLVTQFRDDGDSPKRGLRLSGLGPKCPRALWYSINHPEMAEQLPPWAAIKYSFGHIVEALAIGLAKAAGHTVEGEQDVISVDGVEGHRDCVVDGCIVDVKSASSRSYLKFKDRSLAHSDDFGYLSQLDGYLVGSLQDPIVKVKDKAYLWAIDKQLGHMCLYEHFIREEDIRQRIRDYRAIVALAGPPQCTCETVPDGESGNIRLGVGPSYSAFKHCCWPHLRTFLYAGGPRYLTKVVKQPRNKDGPITEVNRDGNIVYH